MHDAVPGLPVVRTSRGELRGTVEGGAAVFRGIPYAAPPVGALRFAAPAPVDPWDGVRDATTFGPTPAKPAYAPPFDAMLTDPMIPGDDVLNLNVWTPAGRVADRRRAGDSEPGAADGALDVGGPATAGGLPVLVWIHGGAFRAGSGAVPSYDGGAFARDGVVCVTLNYRLGLDGFGLLPDAPDNRGLLDQVAALRWVRDEIAAFGGDPDRVTVAGESAGAMSVVTLLAAGPAHGLFARAIAQSGAGHHVQTADSARRVAAELGRRLDVAPTAAGFATVPLEQLIAAQLQLGVEVSSTDRAAWGALGLDGMPFEPVLGGELVPRRPIDALRDGAGANVPLLIGTNAEEYRFWLVPLGVLPHVPAEGIAGAGAAYGLSAEAASAYADAPTPGAGMEQLVSDWCFRVPAVRAAEARADGPAATHVYEFAWRSPVFDSELGAAHAVEIGFVFDTLGEESGWGMTGPDAPQALADEMHAAWVAFATGGDPGWPAYARERRAVRLFGGPDGANVVVDDPRAARRRAWDGLR